MYDIRGLRTGVKKPFVTSTAPDGLMAEAQGATLMVNTSIISRRVSHARCPRNPESSNLASEPSSVVLWNSEKQEAGSWRVLLIQGDLLVIDSRGELLYTSRVSYPVERRRYIMMVFQGVYLLFGVA